MNNTNPLVEWAKFVDGFEVQESDQKQLLDQLKANRVFRSHSQQDLQVHSLLTIASESHSQQKDFVDRCIDAFVSSQPVVDSEAPKIQIRSATNSAATIPKIRSSKRSYSLVVSSVLAVAATIVLALFITVIRDSPKPVASDTKIVEIPRPEETNVIRSIDSDAPNHSEPQVETLSPGIVDARQPNPSRNLQTIRNPEPELELPSSAILTSTFADLAFDDGAQWKNKVSAGRLGKCTLNLLTGTALIDLDDGTAVFLNGPCIVRLTERNAIRLESGKMMVESLPGDSNEFRVFAGSVKFDNLTQAKLYLFIDENGVESVLSRGSTRLNRLANETKEPLLLERLGLNHVFIGADSEIQNQLDSNSDSPRIGAEPGPLLAHGNGKYLAQIGVQGSITQQTQPEDVEFLFDRTTNLAPPSTRQQIKNFNRLFRQIQASTDAANLSSKPYSFQGAITIQNGDAFFSDSGTIFRFEEMLQKAFGDQFPNRDLFRQDN